MKIMKMSSYSPVNKSIIFVHRMKIVISISLYICALGIIGCTGGGNNRQQSVNETSIAQGGEDLFGPDIIFDTLVNSLGEIIEGEQVLCYFKYHNRGRCTPFDPVDKSWLWLYCTKME